MTHRLTFSTSTVSSSSTSSADKLLLESPLLKPNDILCGKDKTYHDYPGNRLFRQTIASMVNTYSHPSLSKQEKMSMTKQIVFDLQHQHGCRFVKLNKLGEWEEISNPLARDKVSHALRFAAKQQKHTTATTSSSLSSSTTTSISKNTSSTKHRKSLSSSSSSLSSSQPSCFGRLKALTIHNPTAAKAMQGIHSYCRRTSGLMGHKEKDKDTDSVVTASITSSLASSSSMTSSIPTSQYCPAPTNSVESSISESFFQSLFERQQQLKAQMGVERVGPVLHDQVINNNNNHHQYDDKYGRFRWIPTFPNTKRSNSIHSLASLQHVVRSMSLTSITSVMEDDDDHQDYNDNINNKQVEETNTTTAVGGGGVSMDGVIHHDMTPNTQQQDALDTLRSEDLEQIYNEHLADTSSSTRSYQAVMNMVS